MAGVALKGLSKTFDGAVEAVHEMNLDVGDGEFVVLVGPSGCGKSTTLRMIAGLEEPTTGEIWIDGRMVNDVQPKDRDIAMVFQNYALYPHMTVWKNLAFGLKLRRTPKSDIRRRVGEVAEKLGISALLDRRPRALSGGQRQRVALGRALVREPKVFLFDEPLSNLDAKLRVEMRAELKKLHHELGATMIYVTHDQVEAMTLGERIVVMNDGVVQQVDEPLAVYERPANLFVAGFVGTPSMNLIEGELTDSGGRGELVSGAGRIPLPAAWSGAVGRLAGSRGVLGVRPEDIVLERSGEGLPVEVTVTEPLGDQMLVYMNAGDTSLVAKSASDFCMSYGDRAAAAFRESRIHLFDAETGRNVTAHA
jgi:multiple sugar transport system ATP-binding protein